MGNDLNPWKCVVCGTIKPGAADFQFIPCRGGAKHIIQEVVSGSRNPDDGQAADFVAVDSADLRKWGEEAKRLGYDND